MSKSSFSYAHDLMDAIQREHSIHLSDKANSAILRTIQDAKLTAERDMKEHMCYWRKLYFEADTELKEARR